jgi:signal transduction histidine kinase
MQRVRRIVIRDGPPVFDPTIVKGSADRITIAIGALSLCVQVVGVVQVSRGFGNQVGILDHASFAVVALLWLLLGFTVFLQRAGTAPGRFFLLSAAAGSSYLGVGTLSGVNEADALLYATGLVTFAPMLLGFIRSLHSRGEWGRFEPLLYIPPLLLIWPMASDFMHGRQSFGYRAGIISIGIYMLACVVQALWNLSRAETPAAATQTRAILFGLIGGTVPGILVFVVPLAIFGRLLVVTTWQPLIGLLFIVAMSYAALLFEFSTVDIILRRGIVYGLITGAVVIGYGGLGLALAADRITVINPVGGFGFAVVTILIGAGFSPARRFSHAIVDRFVYGGATDRWELLQQLSTRLSTVMQPVELGEVLVRDLQTALRLRGAMLLRRQEDGNYAASNLAFRGRGQVSPQEIEDFPVVTRAMVETALGDLADSFLLIHARPLLPARRTMVPDEYRAFDDLGASLVFPLRTRSGFEAVLCLQSKQTHDEFTASDLELLVPVIGQASAALDNALLLARLEESVSELRTAYTRLATEQEVERSRLARELHDGTSQELAAMITLAKVLERHLEGANPDALMTLHKIQSQAEDAYQGVRNASHALRPAMLDGNGLVPALTSYLYTFSERTDLAVELSVGDIGPLSTDIEWALFRVAQECMENIRKHSASTTAHVSLSTQEDHVVLSVVDHGRGLGEGPAQGIGISNMRERLAAVGGDLRVTNTPGGVRVEASVPLTFPADQDVGGSGRRWNASTLSTA